jgi:protein phosphatase 1 regulatory subunit 7
VVQSLEALTQLEDLWLNDNQIQGLEQVEQALQPVSGSLAVIYLENNPAAAEPQYKERIRALLPKLEQLDSNPV